MCVSLIVVQRMGREEEVWGTEDRGEGEKRPQRPAGGDGGGSSAGGGDDGWAARYAYLQQAHDVTSQLLYDIQQETDQLCIE